MITAPTALALTTNRETAKRREIKQKKTRKLPTSLTFLYAGTGTRAGAAQPHVIIGTSAWNATVNTRRPHAADSAQNPTTSPTGPLAASRPIELPFEGLEGGAAAEAASTSSQEHTHPHNGKDIQLANLGKKDSCSLPAIDQLSYYQYRITQSSPVVFRGSPTHNSATQDPHDTYMHTTNTGTPTAHPALPYSQGSEQGTLYHYTPDLLQLQRCRPQVPTTLPPICCKITTPLQVEAWRKAMGSHPDIKLQEYILDGISHGFRIGFMHNTHSTHPAQSNMSSARDHPEPVWEYLQTEIEAGRVIGPLNRVLFPSVQISRFGVIPKRGQSNKWRLILDLSSPANASVNDGIFSDLCSLHYASVDDAAKIIYSLGKGASLAKLDIAHAYRNVPIHPEDRPLLGMEWQGRLYIDTVLPFGLRSAPKIFSALADVLEWIMLQQGVTYCLHYLDDFLTIGLDAAECEANLQTMLRLCAELGFPVQIVKVEGPSIILIFLGIELDSEKMEMRLPREKLDRLKKTIREWTQKRAARKRELLSLIGQLAHACKVVAPGRTFLRRLIDLSCKPKHLDHWVRLNEEARSDIQWWDCFLEEWNGVSWMYSHVPAQADEVVYTDASGSWGCGAFWAPLWIQCPWRGLWEGMSIAVKELLPIVLAVGVWGKLWTHKHIQVFCDNMAIVEVLRSRTSHHKTIMHLLRCLHFLEAHWEITLQIKHIAGAKNHAADAISRNSLQALRRAAPQVADTPTEIPQPLWDILTNDIDWTSPHWKPRLKSYLQVVLPHPPPECMIPGKEHSWHSAAD